MKRFIIIALFWALFLQGFAQNKQDLRVFEGKPKSPFVATSLSMITPAGGQFYNGKALKGSIFMLTELGLGGMAAMNYYYNSQGAGETFYGLDDDPLRSAKIYTWLFAAVYVYSIMDAYVDAHLSAFPNEKIILEPDPELNGIKLSYQF